MSEEFEMGTSGAMAGAQLGQAFSTATTALGPAGAVIGLLGGIAFGYKARKAKKRAMAEAKRAKKRQLLGQAGEIIRAGADETAQKRGAYALGGLDTASGSAGGFDVAAMREKIYQAEARLAGLPGRESDFRSLA